MSDGGDELKLGAHSGDVLGDVGGTAEGLHPVANADDGDGSFRRDAVHVASQVDVEHRVADDGDPAPLGGRGREEGLEPRAGKG